MTPIIFKHEGKRYRVPEEMLRKSAISKGEFEQKLRNLERAVKTKGAEPGRYDFLDFSEDEVEDASPADPRSKAD